MRSVIAGVVVVLFSSACGVDPGGEQGPPRAAGDTFEGAWVLESGRGPDGEIAILPGYRITLTIDGGTVAGVSACNHYAGNVTIEGSSFAATGLGGTEMGCEPAVMESESRYLTALGAVTTIERDGDALVLTGDEVELVFESLPPVPTADLEDTNWKLQSLVEGSGPDGTASSARPATLVLGSDGTLNGTTGCRDLVGRWVEEGDTIAVTELSAEGKCKPELRDQDGHVLEVLGDGFTAEVEGRTATLTSARGDRGLVYRAEGE